MFASSCQSQIKVWSQCCPVLDQIKPAMQTSHIPQYASISVCAGLAQALSVHRHVWSCDSSGVTFKPNKRTLVAGMPQ
jgi:hypothetical protein